MFFSILQRMSYKIGMMSMVAFTLVGCRASDDINFIPKDSGSTNNKINYAPPFSSNNVDDILNEQDKISIIDVYNNLPGGGSPNRNHEVTPISDGNETVMPTGPQTVRAGRTLSFTVTPDPGYIVSQTVGGNCPLGFWTGNVYTTGVITRSCDAIFSATLQTFAYVTPALAATTIDQFTIDNNGLLSSYSIAYTANGFETLGQMTFAIVNGIQYAYILNPNGAVYWCTINADGSFSNCLTTSSTPTLGSWQARGIAFATFNAQYAYIVDPGNNVVFQCGVDITGNFFNCQQSPSPFNLPTLAPYGIAFATINGVQQAYIADAGSGGSGNFGNVLLCSMQNDGSFSTCSQTPSSGAPNWIPYAVAFTNVNGVQYAYVADNGAGTPGHVYKCSLNSDGTLANSSCTQTPVNDSALINWYPYYIAFQTINETKYAYVVNSSGSSIGNIYRCLLDADGSLTDCILTPDLPPSSWQPSGIAFR